MFLLIITHPAAGQHGENLIFRRPDDFELFTTLRHFGRAADSEWQAAEGRGRQRKTAEGSGRQWKTAEDSGRQQKTVEDSRNSRSSDRGSVQ